MKAITTSFLLIACLSSTALQAKKIAATTGGIPLQTFKRKDMKAPREAQARQMAANKQLCFIENKGQLTDQDQKQRPDLHFKISGEGLNVFVGCGELHYMFYGGAQPGKRNVNSYRMDVELLGANKHATLLKEEQLSYYESYYLPQCPGGIKANAYKKVRYKDVYPNIDWVLYVKNNTVEYEFVVKKGGEVSDIKLKYRGATKLQLNNDGSLTAGTPMGSVNEPAPYSYQSDGKEISSSYKLRGNELSFKTAVHIGALTIDPQLKWATYYGGGGGDIAYAVTCDSSTDIYMVGLTESFNNISTVGSYQENMLGDPSGFLVKFDSSGNRLWGTYFGGNSTNQCTDICTDIYGNIYIAGMTQAANAIASPGSHQEVYGGNYDAFLAKFTKDGARIWSTYYGGVNDDWGFGVSSDDNGNVYLGGLTSSSTAIASPLAFKTTYSGGSGDAFLAKFDSSGLRKWGTYYGGTGAEGITDISYDRNLGGMYICGYTNSNTDISTPGSYQPLYGGGTDDAFVSKFDSSGSLLWGTYYGGTGRDSAASLIGNEGLIYVTGQTTGSNGIATPAAYQATFGGGAHDAFLARFDANGQLAWGTYYGSTGDEVAGEVCLSTGNNDIFISGLSTSTAGIATAGSHQETYGGGSNDAFLAKFEDLGSTCALVWATYYSGTGYEPAVNVATDKLDNVYLAGGTTSPNNISTPGSFKQNMTGPGNAFLARFRNCEPPARPDTIHGSVWVCPGVAHTYDVSPVANAISYVWVLPAGWTGSSTTNTISVIPDGTPGSITVIAINGCDGSPLTLLNINVYPPLHPAINNNNGLLSTGAFTTYQWYKDGQPINAATAQAYSSTQSGDYYVHVTDANGCTGNSDTITVVALGIEPVAKSSAQLTVYPNPVKDILQLEYANLTGSIELTDIAGRVLIKQELQHTLDMKGLAGGIYMLHIANNETGLKLTQKIVKE